MASVQCASLSASPVLQSERASGAASSSSSHRVRISGERQPLDSSFLQTSPGSAYKPSILPAKRHVGTLVRAQRVNFKATRAVTIPFKEGAFAANEYLKETERIVKVTFPDSTRIENQGCRNRKVLSHCHGSSIRASSSDPEERVESVSRRQALLAALALTVPSSHFLQRKTDFQALAVEDERTKIDLIQYELKKVLSKGKSAGVLRLAFHDAGTFDSSDNSGGMNGSILFELDRPESAGLQRPIKVLQKVKRELDLAFPVSWADLIAVAGAAAVAECDGPVIPVQLGRLDSSGPDPEGKLPEETLSASALKQSFQSKGFTTQELVALSGAHTIGNKGFGNPNLFDNSYFQILLQKPWKIAGPDDGMASMIGLATDRALADDEECLKWLKIYAADQGRFFTDFAAVYTKLVNTGARWGQA